jgi:peroxiredoxin
VALAACAGGDGERPRGPVIDAPAPAYAAATLNGDTVSLASLQGSVVLLNFWATWCAPCRHETPFLQSLYEEHADRGLEIVGVSMDTGNVRDLIQDFVDEYGVTYTILHDPRGEAEALYQIVGLPGTFLINRDGTLRWMRYGPVGETDEAFLQALSDALQ